MSTRKRKAEKGSVWTSYSDLFMGMAVVFLILFVFTLLKSGMNQLRHQAKRDLIQKQMEGQVSHHQISQQVQRMKVIQKTLGDLAQREELIQRTVQELKGVSQVLEKRKATLFEVLEDQKRNTVTLKNIKERLSNKNSVIGDLQDKIKALELKNKELNRMVASGKVEHCGEGESRGAAGPTSKESEHGNR